MFYFYLQSIFGVSIINWVPIWNSLHSSACVWGCSVWLIPASATCRCVLHPSREDHAAELGEWSCLRSFQMIMVWTKVYDYSCVKNDASYCHALTNIRTCKRIVICMYAIAHTWINFSNQPLITHFYNNTVILKRREIYLSLAILFIKLINLPALHLAILLSVDMSMPNFLVCSVLL